MKRRDCFMKKLDDGQYAVYDAKGKLMGKHQTAAKARKFMQETNKELPLEPSKNGTGIPGF